MVTTTRSRPRGTSATVTGLAPVSLARSARLFGPRELATATSCPKRVKCRVRAPPMLPAPMIPIFNFLFINVSCACSCDEPSATNLVQPKPLHKRKSVSRLMQEQGQMYAVAPDTADFRLKTLDFGLPSCPRQS